MHDHNKGMNSKGMMWMMIPCLLLVGVLFLGGGKLSGDGYLWPILIGVFIIAHVWMMFRGHGKHRDTNTEEETDDASIDGGTTKKHKHGGGCH